MKYPNINQSCLQSTSFQNVYSYNKLNIMSKASYIFGVAGVSVSGGVVGERGQGGHTNSFIMIIATYLPI